MTARGSGLVILARLRPEYAPPGFPPDVHAYPVSADGEQTVLVAPCGHRLEPGKSERVGTFTGAPCPVCLVFGMGAGKPDGDFDGTREDPAPAELGHRPGQTADSDRYAVGLRGDQLRHLVANNAIQSTLDGRAVVHTMCGHLGWGPLPTAPEQWPLCPDCADLRAMSCDRRTAS